MFRDVKQNVLLIYSILSFLPLILGCSDVETGLKISEAELCGAVEVINRTGYDVMKIHYDPVRSNSRPRQKEAFLRPLIPARGSRFIKLSGYFKYGDDIARARVGNLKVYCNGRWSRLLLWSQKYERFLWWRRMTMFNVVPSACCDSNGSARAENGDWYWCSDWDIDALGLNGRLYIVEMGGDIVLCNRDISNQ